MPVSGRTAYLSREPQLPRPRLKQRIPVRYNRGPQQLFDEAVRRHAAPAMTILDVGSGRRPALGTGPRDGCRYVGLDRSYEELVAAPAGSYDELVVADLTDYQPSLEQRFDLAVSWQVLEHVADLEAALQNIRRYLRPGGHLVALFSGRYSLQAVFNRVIPAGIGIYLMRLLLHRDPDSVFPARYDRCYHRALVGLLDPWSASETLAIYQGGSYFNFSPLLRSAYFVYESWASERHMLDAATYYLLECQR
jgi:SAM-dependent methyltransferase